MIESGGNPLAVGDNFKSLGMLQLQEKYVQDASEFAEKKWKHTDALDEVTSIRIFRAYMERYATQERLGRPVTYQDIARIHNGGPNGHNKISTLKYWDKVKDVWNKE